MRPHVQHQDMREHARLEGAIFLAALAALFLVLSLGDVWTTWEGAQRLGVRFYEQWPTTRLLLAAGGWSAFIAAKLGCGVLYLLAVRLLGRDFGTMRWALLLACVAEGAIVAYNLHLLLSLSLTV